MASSGREEECRAFTAAQGAAQGEGTAGSPESAALADTLGAAIDQAAAAWPDLAIDRVGFAVYLGQRIPSDVDPVDALRARRIDELYLTFACVRGDPAACRHLDTRYLTELARQLAHHRIASDIVAETVQKVRVQLLTGDRPGLLSFHGLGALKGWLRVTGLRAAIRAQRGVQVDEPEDVAEALADAAGDPALQYQRRLYETEFRIAFGQAVAELSVRERNLLKQSVLYGATIDDLGALYRVHRATVARWLAAARERLADESRRRLIAHLGIEPSDYDSIVHLIQSQLDVSMARLLG
jgi:RNA polymerase sigma-70 factor (ECF subfamily)